MSADVLAANRDWWEREVAKGCGFTRPWLDLDPAVVRAYAEGRLAKAPRPLDEVFPTGVLRGVDGRGVDGKDVLCLAAGGGQQSAVFGLLGARVTVVDLAEGQLVGDRRAASHYGYEVRTLRSDMADLSALADASFDLVFQAPSMGYARDVRRVYAEVARVLRPGGIYRADAQNPLSQFVDESSWDGAGYRISVPYAVRERKRAPDKDVWEYRHHLSDVFNGLVERGLAIESVHEAPSDLHQDGEPEPGTWLHSLLYLPGHFAIVARKR